MMLTDIRLTAEQQQTVIEAIRVLDNLSVIMDDLEACGAACQARRNEVHVMRQKLQNLLNRFSPK